MARDIDWKAYLNRLVYCFGCGKFGLPRRGKPKPMGWKLLYQPHADARPGLHVCSESCANDVRDAMAKGPVNEPLKMGLPPMMDVELRHQMMQEVKTEAEERIEHERRFVFTCQCGVDINPLSERGVPTIFNCPRCGLGYQAEPLEPGEVRFTPIQEKRT
jgi:hypothetical protein